MGLQTWGLPRHVSDRDTDLGLLVIPYYELIHSANSICALLPDEQKHFPYKTLALENSKQWFSLLFGNLKAEIAFLWFLTVKS